jgi:hypothetical protein
MGLKEAIYLVIGWIFLITGLVLALRKYGVLYGIIGTSIAIIFFALSARLETPEKPSQNDNTKIT